MLTRSPIQKKLVQCCMCAPNILRPAWRSEYVEGEKKYYCQSHAMQKSANKQISINKERNDKREKFYQFIHTKFKGICQETGRQLTYSNKHCAHILPKSKYDYFEFDTRNAILVSWATHAIIDKGSPAQRKELKVWNIIQQTRKLLLEEVGMEFNEKHWEIITF